MSPRILLLTRRRIPTISSNETLSMVTVLLLMTVWRVSSTPSRPTLAMATVLGLGTQDTEQDHQGGLLDFNEQPVEPNGQDEANPGGDQEGEEEGEEGEAEEGEEEEGEEEEAAAAGGRIFDVNLEGVEELVIMDALPPDPFEQLIPVMVYIVHQHHQFVGHMLAERD